MEQIPTDYNGFIEKAVAAANEHQKGAYDWQRLRVLVKEGFVLLQQHWKKPLGQIDRDWETFKTQNNL